jgi:hypothetical protein
MPGRHDHLESPSSGGVVAVAAVALLAGCSTPTTSADVWKNPAYAARPINKVIVFGGRMKDANRRTVEEELVGALTVHGVHATPSYMTFPGPVPAEAAAQQAIRTGDYDAVIVSTLRARPERTIVAPGKAFDGAFWSGYHGPYWGLVTGEPGPVESDAYVRFETTLWDPRGSGTLIWSDVTRTENPSSTAHFVQGLVNDIIPAMSMAGLLSETPGEPISYAHTLD